MRSRLAEGGALAMRLSPVFSNAARRGAAFSLPLKRRLKFHYHRPTEVSTGANCRAATPIGSLVRRWRRSSPIGRQARADDAKADEIRVAWFLLLPFSRPSLDQGTPRSTI